MALFAHEKSQAVQADADRFLMVAIIFGLLALSCYMMCYKLSTERIVAPATSQPKNTVGKTLKGLLQNKPLLWILTASLTFMVCFMLISAVNVYLFKDYFGNAKALSMVGLLQSVTVFIAMPMVKPLVEKFGKKETVSAGVLLAAFVYVLLYFLPDLTSTQFIALLSLDTPSLI